MEKELKKEKYADSGLDFEQMFRELDIVFEICLLWDDVEHQIGGDKKEECPLFAKYFDLNVMCACREAAFSNIENLQKALQPLYDAYGSMTEDLESSYALLLLSLVKGMVLQCEKDQNWFEGDEKRNSDLLVRTAKKCYQLEQENRSYDKNLDGIKVLVYRFRQYCGG